MRHEELLTLCNRWEDAFSRRDLDALAGLYAEDAVVESPMAGTLTGRDALLDAHNALFASFPDPVWTFERALVDGDRAVVVAEMQGTHSGLVLGLAPTGRAYRVGMVFLFDIREGLIARDRRIYDFTGLLVQVGALKAKPV